jgi:uncharacterized membrane protein YhaH (DUF805 family)
MNFKEAITAGFQNYVNFSGRAAKSQYWYWALFAAVIAFGSSFLDTLFFPDMELAPLYMLSSLAMFLPSLAVSVRRLHDVDRSGWWLLIAFTLIGMIIPLLYWYCIEGTKGANRFGPASDLN